MRRLPALCLLLLAASGSRAGVLFGPVTGPAGLDVSGTIYYAIDLGDTADRPISGRWFDADSDGRYTSGYSFVAPNIYASGWGYGSIADPALRSAYDTMRWIAASPLDVTLRNLPPGQQVKVQLLLSEGYWNNSNRRYNILLEGATEFTNVDPWTLWGSKQPGLATALVTVSADGVLNIRLSPAAGAPDPNPVLDGIIVSAPTMAPGGLRVPLAASSVSASAVYSAQFPAAAVVDGSWGETQIGSAYDFWLLPDRQGGYLQFDLGANWELQFIELHNTDNRGYHDRGTIAYHLVISPDASFATAKTIAAGTLPIYAGGWYARPVDSDEYWRYARLYVDDFGGSLHWGQDAAVYGGGLAEVRLYGVIPEPATFGLLGASLLALRRRRRVA